MSDERFARVAKDPRFKKTPMKERKVKIDSRFEKMFTDKSFSTKYFVDKRGSHIGKTSTEDLHKFYDLAQEETDDIVDSVLEQQGKDKTKNKQVKSKSKKPEKKKKKKNEAKISKQEISEEESEATTEDENSNGTRRLPQEADVDNSDEEHEEKIDHARGEGNPVSSDDDSEDDDAEGYFALEQGEVEHPWGELHTEQTKMAEELTRRLAVCSLDWDRVTATDIFVLFNSFKLREGFIHSVKIYPSEFGLEKMKHEDCYGPEELQEDPLQEKHNTDNQEGSGFSSEKLRQYQLNRLKYYYAVVECDSAETAEKLYEECDGVEFALSGNLLDLRFIPEDMEFEHEPHSVATELPAPATYTAPDFSTTALHQTNVKLTWDETDPKRTRMTMRKFNKQDILEMDFKAYLASSSEEEDDDEERDHDQEQDSGDEEEQIEKYKELLKEIDNKEKREGEENDMEITWEPGLQETADDLVTRKLKEKSEQKLTPWDKYQEQKKKRRKERKRKEEAASEGEDDVPADVDLSNPFFSQVFGPKFKESKTEERKPNRRHKKKGKHIQEEGAEEGQKQKVELELLLMDDTDDREHFSLKGIMDSEKKSQKRKKRKQKVKEPRVVQDSFQIDVNDSRFNALYTSHHFAVDPSDPQFKKTKAMETIIDERQKRRQRAEKNNSPEAQKTTENKQVMDPSLTMLVKSVKSKTGQFHQRKRKKTHHS